MSESQHTPGEWSVTNDAWERGWSVDSDRDNSMVAVTAVGRRDPICLVVEGSAFGRDDELDANARLIAAAPDMFEALKAMVAAFGDIDVTIDGVAQPEADPAIIAARAALRKATGEAA